MKVLQDIDDISYNNDDYDYQPLLTIKLDQAHSQTFTQELINEIVLWKINRYAQINPETLESLNSEVLKNNILDTEFTRHILKALLKTPGIRLPMASTILRFRNPNVYQIIDQRAYRILYGSELRSTDPRNDKVIDQQILHYLNYLEKLRITAGERSWSFSEMDRILYMLDLKHNKNIPIKT
ncbi:hypothetical protein A3860_13970 [Niastella vici]|uniref:Uncharacterized protein n=1 Tax=Niastella vici TaxID=1703345 RepID=A0A1V9G7I8_9BACT|nr:hypothetical protein [Niastella vici]OQP66583.1 hypothetical protein A3860_13970 [Niastella vici]